jgi:hypothetical protein
MPNEKDQLPEVMPAWAKALTDKITKLEADNKMFTDFAGKNKIASWQDGKADKTQRYGHFKKYNSKIVVGWGRLDYDLFNPQSKTAVGEKIMTELIYLDGTKEKVNYVNFINSTEMVKVRLVQTNPLISVIEFPPEVVTEFKLETPQITIESKFLNA